VLMVKDGQIVERGTHRTLLEQKGAYYDLYMSQFREEREAEEAALLAQEGSQSSGVPSAVPGD
jgi:ATP-binding cassette subfamily B multidrug efflux pump